MASARVAKDEQVPAAVAADVAERHRGKRLDPAARHRWRPLLPLSRPGAFRLPRRRGRILYRESLSLRSGGRSRSEMLLDLALTGSDDLHHPWRRVTASKKTRHAAAGWPELTRRDRCNSNFEIVETWTALVGYIAAPTGAIAQAQCFPPGPRETHAGQLETRPAPRWLSRGRWSPL